MAKRDDKGRFIKGGDGGPGRPPMEVEKAYIDAATSACTPSEWAMIVKQAVSECSHEDYRIREKARNFVLKVLHGNSPAVVMQMANIQYHEQAKQITDDNGRKKGLSAETVAEIKAKILGIKA